MVGGAWDVAAGAVAAVVAIAAVVIVVVSVAAVAVVQSDRQAIDNKACSTSFKRSSLANEQVLVPNLSLILEPPMIEMSPLNN